MHRSLPGGLRTDQFDPDTLESRCCPGLYAAGEVLDIDGDCGGFNLQWACPAAIWRDYWGTAAAKSRKSEKTSLFFHQYSNIFH